MCAPPLSPATASSGVCAEAMARGVCTRLGQETAELRSGHADCPLVLSQGKVAPRAVPARPRCASFRKPERDRFLQGSYPVFPNLRPPLPRAQTLGWRLPGKPGKKGSGQAGSSDFPHFNSLGLGSLTAALGLPAAERSSGLAQVSSLGSQALSSAGVGLRAAQTLARVWRGFGEDCQGQR
jgi:hypothetical protein